MRLWSLHPEYLDSKGLVALWREGLLAQKVLLGNTRGYKNHPQLTRFKGARDPVAAIAVYLKRVADAAEKRGYHFDRSKIVERKARPMMKVTRGQLQYEFTHLLSKLESRDPEQYAALKKEKAIKPHPMFYKVDGEVEAWERRKLK